VHGGKSHGQTGSSNELCSNCDFTKQLCDLLSNEDIVGDLLNSLTFILSDDQDSVRLLSVDILAEFSKKLCLEEKTRLILPYLRSLWNDKSWRVRYVVADKFVAVANIMGKELQNEEFYAAYAALLKDTEAEVRNAACLRVPEFCGLLDEASVEQHVIPILAQLSQDSSQHVRSSLASKISSLSPILGKQKTLEFLLPLLLGLLQDDFHEVRLNIISKLDCVSSVTGIDLLSQTLLPAIVKLAEDKQWRVRLAIIEHMPLLARQFV
jgi:serine/threonine-protein phosphatase 2A regulatory subunit A